MVVEFIPDPKRSLYVAPTVHIIVNSGKEKDQSFHEKPFANVG